LLWALPWLAFAVAVAVRLRDPWPLPEAAKADRDSAEPLPHITVIVPARNEARSIGECISSLLSSTYPSFDVVLVDDCSDDGTADLARTAADGVPGGLDRLSVVDGQPLPAGWFGKPWACLQGYRAARGQVLLFTDADTWHGPDLLARCMAAVGRDRLDALTLLAWQRMESFWERAVQPQVFFMIGWRYGNVRRLYNPVIEAPRRWRDAIANGQFILMRRDAYEAVGTHACVAGEVVEDLRLAQEVVKAGQRFALLDPGPALQTRMYRSFADLAQGWTKNLWTGGVQAFGGSWAKVLPWVGAALILLTWVVPSAVLLGGGALALLGQSPGVAVLVWSAAVTGLSVAFWSVGMRRFHAPGRYGLTYPLGAAVLACLLVRSALRGTRIEWKGRRYSGPQTPEAM